DRAAVAGSAGEEAAGVYDTGSVREAGGDTADLQWEGGSQAIAGAGRVGLGSRPGVCRAADAGRRNRGWELECGARGGGGGGDRQRLGAGRTFAAGHASQVASSNGLRSGSTATDAIPVADHQRVEPGDRAATACRARSGAAAGEGGTA